MPRKPTQALLKPKSKGLTFDSSVKSNKDMVALAELDKQNLPYFHNLEKHFQDLHKKGKATRVITRIDNKTIKVSYHKIEENEKDIQHRKRKEIHNKK